VPPETILSASYFALHTAEFYDFYRRYMVHPEARPNAVHRYLYELEKEDKLRGIVTQNIDGLHKMAGNKRVYELHGSVHRNYCTGCGRRFTLGEILPMPTVPLCPHCGGSIRPDVVLYGEMLDDTVTARALEAIRTCDLLIVGGTSLVVYPAAGMIQYRRARCNLALINMDQTAYDGQAELVLHGDVGQALRGAWLLAQE
jgi:NAD-dependent deacetylase